jgi:hypothetical protein
MYCLSDKEIDFIANDIRERGIHIAGLHENLLDHICIIIEERLEKPEEFESVYAAVIKTFYTSELKEIEEEALFLVKYNRHRVLSRGLFFTILFSIFIGPFIAYDVLWLINSFAENGWYLPRDVWGATFVYSLFPLMILLVLLLTPEGLDPLIPRRSKILFGFRPFIKIVPVK